MTQAADLATTLGPQIVDVVKSVLLLVGGAFVGYVVNARADSRREKSERTAETRARGREAALKVRDSLQPLWIEIQEEKMRIYGPLIRGEVRYDQNALPEPSDDDSPEYLALPEVALIADWTGIEPDDNYPDGTIVSRPVPLDHAWFQNTSLDVDLIPDRSIRKIVSTGIVLLANFQLLQSFEEGASPLDEQGFVMSSIRQILSSYIREEEPDPGAALMLNARANYINADSGPDIHSYVT